MHPILKRLMPLAAAATLLAGCGKGIEPVTPVPGPPLSSLVISPEADTLRVGQSRLFTAVARDISGNVTSTTLGWSSSDPAVVTVNAAGSANAAGEGLARVIVAAGGKADTATVFVYPDTGWIAQTSNATEDLNGVFFDPGGRAGWVVGNAGVVLATTDAGTTWTRSIPTTYSLHGVWFTSRDEGWAVGNGGTVLRTTDGGAVWTRLTNVGESKSLMHVHFATRDTGWAVGTGGLVLRTFDRGASWQKVYPVATTLNSVMFAGTRDGWAVGDGGAILGTHDRGLTWFRVQPAITSQNLKGAWRRSAALAVAVGAQGVVPMTAVTPDSVAWQLQSAGAANQLEGVCFPTDQVGYAVGLNGTGTVLRSDDGGMSWQPQQPDAQFRLNAVFFVDALRGWAVGNNGLIRHTAHGGH